MSYFVWFSKYSDILVENRQFYSLILHLATPPLRMTSLEFRQGLQCDKTGALKLPQSDMIGSVVLTKYRPARDRRTDRQTSGIAQSLSRSAQLCSADAQ